MKYGWWRAAVCGFVGGMLCGAAAAQAAPARTVQDAPGEGVSAARSAALERDLPGARADGITDDTAALERAVRLAERSGTGQVRLPWGHYRISRSITVPRGVSLRGDDNALSDDGGHTFLEGDFAGPLLIISHSGGQWIQGITLKNIYWGGRPGLAGAIRVDGVTGPGLIRNTRIEASDTGIWTTAGGELDSWSLENVYFWGDDHRNGQSRGLAAFGRNTHVTGGRCYAAHVCYSYGGDDWIFEHLNVEFTDIPFQQGPSSGAVIAKNHIETSGMLWTNATVLPDTSTFPWKDRSGEGLGWTGTVLFANNNILFNAHGNVHPQNAPLLVLHAQSGMVGRLELVGNNLSLPGVSISPSFRSVSGSFDYTVPPVLVNGVRVLSTDAINVPRVPNDGYTSWTDLSGGVIQSSLLSGRGNAAACLDANGKLFRAPGPVCP